MMAGAAGSCSTAMSLGALAIPPLIFSVRVNATSAAGILLGYPALLPAGADEKKENW